MTHPRTRAPHPRTSILLPTPRRNRKRTKITTATGCTRKRRSLSRLRRAPTHPSMTAALRLTSTTRRWSSGCGASRRCSWRSRRARIPSCSLWPSSRRNSAPALGKNRPPRPLPALHRRPTALWKWPLLRRNKKLTFIEFCYTKNK